MSRLVLIDGISLSLARSLHRSLSHTHTNTHTHSLVGCSEASLVSAKVPPTLAVVPICDSQMSDLPCQQALDGLLQLTKSLILVKNQLLARIANWSNREGWWSLPVNQSIFLSHPLSHARCHKPHATRSAHETKRSSVSGFPLLPEVNSASTFALRRPHSRLLSR